MPPVRNQLNSQPLGDAQPILDYIQQVGHNIMHPIDYIHKMLSPAPPPPPAPPGPTMVDEANQSFRTPEHMTQPPNPVVAPPRRKPMM